MTLGIEELIFNSRALAQTHPLTGPAQAYVNQIVGRERLEQPVPEIGVWAGHALMAGYCLRRVEEDDNGVGPPPASGPSAGATDVDALDKLVDDVADRIRTDQAGDILLYSEALVVDALDRLIGGEVERRLSHWEGTIDDDSYAELEEYIAWWTLKGYALRVAERLVQVEDS